MNGARNTSGVRLTNGKVGSDLSGQVSSHAIFKDTITLTGDTFGDDARVWRLQVSSPADATNSLALQYKHRGIWITAQSFIASSQNK